MFWNRILVKILFKLVFGGECTSKNIQEKTFRDYFLTLFLLTLIFLQEKKDKTLRRETKGCIMHKMRWWLMIPEHTHVVF